MAARIDVLIPLFNTVDTLGETLESVTAQSERDFRVLLIDDGSTDDTPALIASWAERDPRFVVFTKPNSGIVDTLNMGLSHVTAPLVARLDGDDICAPNRFAMQHGHLEAHPDCVAVGGRVEHIDECGNPVRGLPQPGDPAPADPWRIPAREPYIVHPFLMARVDALRAAGGYRHVPHSEDSDLFWRLREFGALHNLPEIVGQYRFHSSSISGASVLNGRVMAVGSQLGAWAARQRERRLPDPGFGRDLIARLKAAGTLAAMIDIIAPLVGEEELARFRLACGIKLLELAGYRPYEIEKSDVDFIKAAIGGGKHLELPKDNRDEIRWYRLQAAARLIKAKKFGLADGLVNIAEWPAVVAKTILR